MGEFSGIDADAFQKMSGSFAHDRDHLRDRASYYASQFGNLGLDSSTLGEIKVICGWMDDQTPMLTRRYHLAMAADKPYPGHKGMASVDESMVGTTALSKKEGKALANRFGKEVDGGQEPDEALFAELKEHADDPDYLKAFYNQLGEERLLVITNGMAEQSPAGRYGDHPDQVEADRDVLAQTFGTFTKVAFEGQTAKQKQASWNRWLDAFKDPAGNFRPDYISGLLPGGSQDKDFLLALGGRFLSSDPEKSGTTYMGASQMENGAFGSDHYSQVFTALAGNPEAAGEWMDGHYAATQELLYPGSWLNLGSPPARATAFAHLMTAGTITLKATNAPLAQKLTARVLMDNFRHQNGPDSTVHTYVPIDYYYSQLVSAYWDDMEYGIVSPTGDLLWGADAQAAGFTTKMSQWNEKAFQAAQDPHRPGVEIGTPLWQALLNESARSAKGAGQLSALFDAYRNRIDLELDDSVSPTDEHAQDYLSIKQGSMMGAYDTAFTYAENSLEGEADSWADEVNSTRSSLVNGAYDYAMIARTDGVEAAAGAAKEAAVGFGQDTAKQLLTGWLISEISVKPEDAPGSLASRYGKISDVKVPDEWQDAFRRKANGLLDNTSREDGTFTPTAIRVRDHPRSPDDASGTTWYSGDPYGAPPKGHPAAKPPVYIHSPADDFLNPNGTVKETTDMTPRQRTAYNMWLQDPAVVRTLEGKGFSQVVQFQKLATD
ncbi:hypothetical protein [Actinacidiphila yeochonensis]|uniref:hypothetical protein n=1 Tax=Actinacidiphila yeochonensis TaxID=89050 RepID=UPI00055CFC4C|nr:hypothetical protein [Actinacidiphila yeochonensis]